MDELRNEIFGFKKDAVRGTFFVANQPPLRESNAKLSVKRFFTKEGMHSYDEITWDRRDAKITSAKGETIFEQRDVEVPSFWSQTATDIVAEKYFAGHVGKPGRETSVRQLIDRGADTITGWGI